MARRNGFIVSVFLVLLLTSSAVLFGQRLIDLDRVWGDMRVLGNLNNDASGCAVASGDINGDGFMDIIIGAYQADPGIIAPRPDAGEVYVVYGLPGQPATLDLNATPADITIYGNMANDETGWSVASGDINADGYDDIIIGARLADPGTPARIDAGTTYVIFGGIFPMPYIIDLSFQPADITIYGNAAGDSCGYSVASGNVNGDAFDDVIIGAPYADPGGRIDAGTTYVINGAAYTPPVVFDLSLGPAFVNILGFQISSFSGSSVASGDVDADGFDDIIIGAPMADTVTFPPPRIDAGHTYVIFGVNFPPATTIDLAMMPANILVEGPLPADNSGRDVASGDVNGDGFMDIIIGAPLADIGNIDAGVTHVIFGANFTAPYIVDLFYQAADLTVIGDDPNSESGGALASGDINADGFDDVIIGAYAADPPGGIDAGETYIIFGSSLTTPPYWVLLNMQPPDILISGDDANDISGDAVACGDVNLDGYCDIIVGAPWADPGGRIDAGETYLIAGGGAFITAHGLGGTSWIKAFSLLTNDWGSFKAFGAVNSQGEVHLAVGDMDADSRDEIAAGQGEGGKSWVKFFEVDGFPISTFKTFGAANVNGEVHLAIGNFDVNPANIEIAVAQGEGGQSWIKVFDNTGLFITAFKAFGAANAQGEVHLAAGDLENADGIDEIIAGMGEGGSSVVKIFSYNGTIIRSFQAFSSAENPGGEVHLAVGDFDSDAVLEIAAATGFNGGNLIKLYEKDGTLISGFYPFGMGGNPNGDVQITAADIDNDGLYEIMCAHGEGGVSQVKVFKPDGSLMLNFKAFGGVNALGEVHLGRSNY